MDNRLAGGLPRWRRFKKTVLRNWMLYLFILPSFVYILVFHYFPIYGIQIAFRNYKPSRGIWGSQWAGLKYFRKFLTSYNAWTIIRNTIVISLYQMLAFPVPILLALVLHYTPILRLKKITQSITYAPHFISTVVLCGMVIAFTAPDTGIINSLVVLLGGKSVDYMTQESSWRAIYVISDIWKNTGWSSIIYLAALAGIDPQLHESAQIDGASRLQRVWHINLPGIRQTIILLFILDCGKIMSVGFEKAYLLQNALNLPVSEIISTYVYKTGVQGAKFSYTTAIGLFNSLVNVMMLLIVNRISRALSDTSLF